LISLAKAGWLSATVWTVLPIHYTMLLYGWMTQFAISIAYWMLPRLEGNQRGRVRFFAAALVLLNGGVLVACVNQLAGQVLILLAMLNFAIHAIPRISRLSPSEKNARSR